MSARMVLNISAASREINKICSDFIHKECWKNPTFWKSSNVMRLESSTTTQKQSARALNEKAQSPRPKEGAKVETMLMCLLLS